MRFFIRNMPDASSSVGSPLRRFRLFQPAAAGRLPVSDGVAERVVIGADTVVVCDLNKIRDTIDLPLSELTAEKLRIVKLETRPEAFFKPSKTFVSENYIGVVGYEPGLFQTVRREREIPERYRDAGARSQRIPQHLLGSDRRGLRPRVYPAVAKRPDSGLRARRVVAAVDTVALQISERDFPGEPRLDGFGKRPAVRKRGNRKFRLEPRYAGKRGRPDRCGPLPDQGGFRE